MKRIAHVTVNATNKSYRAKIGATFVRDKTGGKQEDATKKNVHKV